MTDQSSKTLLTIGIPTFNRGEFLARLLAHLIPACEQLQIDVLVSDNCSTDDTPEICRAYIDQSCFRYVRNNENIGFDRNVLNLFHKARTQFLWLMGDDDDIVVEKLESLLSMLTEHPKTAFIYVNYNVFEAKLRSRYVMPHSIDYVLETPQYFMDNFLYKATFLSTNVINLKYFEAIQVNPKVIGKGWIHVHVALEILSMTLIENTCVAIVADKLVMQRCENNDYDLDKFNNLFIYNFEFVLKNSHNTLISSHFLRDFFLLNIRPRLYRIAKETSLYNCVNIYRKVRAIYPLKLADRLLFYLFTTIVSLFGFEVLRKCKRLLHYKLFKSCFKRYPI